VSKSNVKYSFKANIDLVIRMHFDHNYSIEDICLRLRYPNDIVEKIIDNHKLKHNQTDTRSS